MVSGGLVRGGGRLLPLLHGRRPCGGGGGSGRCRILVALPAGGTPPAAARARRVQSRLQGSQWKRALEGDFIYAIDIINEEE